MSPNRTTARDVVGDLHLQAVAVQDNLPPMRHRLQQWLGEQGVPVTRADDVVLCACEALTNVVQHAYRGRDVPAMMNLTGRRSPNGTLIIEVTDTGRWQTPQPEIGVGGMGLPIMRQIADSLELEHSPSTRVTARYSAASTRPPS